MLLADAPMNVIQIDWQSLAALGSVLGGALLGAAKIVAAQWAANIAFEAKRHDESRQDAQEARNENRALSKMIMDTQARSVETQGRIAEALAGVQREITHVVARLDRLDGAGAPPHAPLSH